MEEIYEEKNNEVKKSKKGLVFIIFLILVIIGLVGYIAYDKGFIKIGNNDEIKEEKNTKKEKEESVTFTDSELEEYVNYISPISVGPSGIYNIDKVVVSEMTPAQKIAYIGSHVHEKHTSTDDYAYDILSEEDVKTVVEKIYGPNTYQRTVFNLGCGDYTFNEKDGKYYAKTGCGGTSATSVSNIIIDYKATKKKLEITTAYAFADGMTKKFYKDYNKTIVLDNYPEQSEDPSYFDSYIKNNKDKLSHLVYTFESKDGRHYYFTKLVNNK